MTDSPIESLLTKLQSGIRRNDTEANLRQLLRAQLRPLGPRGKRLVAEALLSISTPSVGDDTRSLKALLENYQSTYFPRLQRRVLAPGMELLDDDSRKELTLRLNQRRGKQYESGLGLWLVREGIRRLYPSLVVCPEIDRRVFKIILPGGQEVKRRADIFISELSAVIEIKSGRISSTVEIRSQIDKDSFLLREQVVKQVDWVLFGGASSAVLDRLDSENIGFLDVSLE